MAAANKPNLKTSENRLHFSLILIFLILTLTIFIISLRSSTKRTNWFPYLSLAWLGKRWDDHTREGKVEKILIGCLARSSAFTGKKDSKSKSGVCTTIIIIDWTMSAALLWGGCHVPTPRSRSFAHFTSVFIRPTAEKYVTTTSTWAALEKNAAFFSFSSQFSIISSHNVIEWDSPLHLHYIHNVFSW